ncbi:MAG: PASTA domain-containing protein [Trueperaceae bacterium]|nr:PASTA domain-containing protein [Trueperaceae bacterium]
MPLIDGTYEILDQRPLADGRTLVHATDPDGRPVRLVWYDVPTDAEAAFERYRRTLRRLGREPDVLLREVVSRPGARYAVWEDADEAAPAALDADWRERLAVHGLDPASADIRRRGRATVLAGLDWDEPEPGSAGGLGDTSDPTASPAPSFRRGLRRASLPSLSTSARTWLTGLLVLLAAFALLLVGWTRDANAVVVSVPDVTGLPAQVGAESLHDLGLVVTARTVASGGPAGTVVATDPAAGVALRPGRTVRLSYVLPQDGAATVETPSLAGATADDAARRLTASDLVLGDVARVPARLPIGTVLAQRPSPGARSEPGDEVHVLVSDGPRPELSFLPDLVGSDVADARELARLAGLPADRVLVDAVTVTGAPAGQVVGMTPVAWRPFRVNDATLRLLVSDPGGSGADAGATDAPAVPDVVGLSLDRARTILSQAGRGATVARTVDRALPEAVVLQDPPPGSRAGGPVRLFVNARPVRLPLPTPEARILAPRLRWVPYRFLVEPGIPAQSAEIRARTAGGDTAVVTRREVRGGDVIEGTWPTLAPGPVMFELFLNDVPYAEVRVNREVDGP